LIDGREVGRSPQAITIRAEPGTHSVVAEKQGYPLAAATISLAAGEQRSIQMRLVSASHAQPSGFVDTTVHADPVEPSTALLAGPRDEQPWRPPAWAPWAAAGIGLVALGVGTYFGGRAMSNDGSTSDAQSASIGANVFFVTAGVAAVSAGGMWYWRYKRGD
jgi:hypothetical protein